MSKFVCIDNVNCFYLPVESVISFKEATVDTKSGVEVKYWEEDKVASYFVDTWNSESYCKSLQQHINSLID